MKLDHKPRDTFMAETTAADRPAAQVLRELMRDYISHRRKAREYDEFLRRKIETARASMRAGIGTPQEEIEAETALRRAELLSGAGEAGL